MKKVAEYLLCDLKNTLRKKTRKLMSSSTSNAQGLSHSGSAGEAVMGEAESSRSSRRSIFVDS